MLGYNLGTTANIKATVQYSQNLRATVVAFNTVGAVSINRKRGQIGMDAAGILPEFNRIIIHDCWSSCRKYQDALHAVCCAHLLRKLNGVEAPPEQMWAARFKELLLAMKKVKDKALVDGKEEVSYL